MLFYYYGSRFYSATLARWINRDPIGNDGGLNLYGLQHLEGDIVGWQEKQRPVEVPRDPAACAAALKEGKAQAEACKPN